MNSMKEKITLPIHIDDVESVTDCWIYNRLAIIKTSPYYRDWMASHYNLCSGSGNFHFGEINMYPPSQMCIRDSPKCNPMDNDIYCYFAYHTSEPIYSKYIVRHYIQKGRTPI